MTDATVLKMLENDSEMQKAVEGQNLKLDKLYATISKLYPLQTDQVYNPGHLYMEDGVIRYNDGTGTDQWIKPNHIMLKQMYGAFDVNHKHVEKMALLSKHRPGISDRHFNDLFLAEQAYDEATKKGRSFLIRSYRKGLDHQSSADSPMTGRALLSNSYKAIDNLPIMQAVLEMVKEVAKETGRRIVPITQSLTETSMFLRFVVPDIEMKTYALNRYKNPNTGEGGSGGVASGFIVRNSETGHGALWAAPRFFIDACKNGLIWKKEGMFKTHLGTRLDEGVVKWSETTQRNNARLIISQLRDVVKTFLSPDFLGRYVSQIEEAAAYELNHPLDCTRNFCKDLGFSQAQTEETINYLMAQGSSESAFDIAQAVTFTANELNPDKRWIIESGVGGSLGKIKNFDYVPEPKKKKGHVAFVADNYR